MSRAKQLGELLWSPSTDGEIFALLDGARDPRIYAALPSCGVDHECLFDGPLPAELAAAAPHLLRLHPWAHALEWLAEHGWGQSWGIFLASRASMIELRRHLRRLFLVKDPSSRVLYFRYYDPRVLRAYLPTCTDDELAQVFGPISRIWVEAARPRQIIEFHPDGGKRFVPVEG